MEGLSNKSKTNTVRLFSKLLNKEMHISVYLPEGYDKGKSLPVLYFFHGRNGNHNILFNLEIPKVMNSLICQKKIQPFLIVCPQIDNSRGLNSSSEYHEVPDPEDKNRSIHLGMYMDYFLTEVIPFIDTTYRTISSGQGRYIGGVSGGGYAALHIALRNPQLFSKVGGHMPAIELNLEEEDKPFYQDMQAFTESNPIHITDHLTAKDIEVYLDCGDKDEGGFYKSCALLQDVLAAKGVKSQNHLFKGSHNLEYITSNLEKYLLFYGR